MATSLNDELTTSGYHIWYDNSYGMYHINIKQKEFDMRVLLGYHSNPIFNIDKFTEYNRGYILNGERIGKYDAILHDIDIDKWISDFNNIKEQAKVLYNEMGKYECNYMFDWSELGRIY